MPTALEGNPRSNGGGAGGGNRTRNLRITNPALCLLKLRRHVPRARRNPRPGVELRSGRRSIFLNLPPFPGRREVRDSNPRNGIPLQYPLCQLPTRPRLSGVSSVAHFRFATARRCRGRSSAPSFRLPWRFFQLRPFSTLISGAQVRALLVTAGIYAILRCAPVVGPQGIEP